MLYQSKGEALLPRVRLLEVRQVSGEIDRDDVEDLAFYEFRRPERVALIRVDILLAPAIHRSSRLFGHSRAEVVANHALSTREQRLTLGGEFRIEKILIFQLAKVRRVNIGREVKTGSLDTRRHFRQRKPIFVTKVEGALHRNIPFNNLYGGVSNFFGPRRLFDSTKDGGLRNQLLGIDHLAIDD